VLGTGRHDPFVTPAPPDSADARVEKLVGFAMVNSKRAITKDGGQWDQSQNRVVPEIYRAVFNGVDNRYLSEGGLVPIGGIRIDDVPKPHARVVNNQHLIAIRLASSPTEVLRAVGYDTQRMSVINQDVARKGHRCVEVTMPYRAVNSTRTARVFVDPSRSFVPIALVLEKDARVEREFSVDYVADESMDWFVSKWTDRQFNSRRKVIESRVGRVRRVSINRPIDDSVFELEFPEGAHVVVRKGERREPHVVLAGGSMEPMRAADFGRPLPKTRPK
jgi:hypothetical protein